MQSSDPRTTTQKSRPHIEPRDANVADGVLAAVRGLRVVRLAEWVNHGLQEPWTCPIYGATRATQAATLENFYIPGLVKLRRIFLAYSSSRVLRVTTIQC